MERRTPGKVYYRNKRDGRVYPYSAHLAAARLDHLERFVEPAPSSKKSTAKSDEPTTAQKEASAQALVGQQLAEQERINDLTAQAHAPVMPVNSALANTGPTLAVVEAASSLVVPEAPATAEATPVTSAAVASRPTATATATKTVTPTKAVTTTKTVTPVSKTVTKTSKK